ncbi:MAG: hypothetical protein IKB16_11295 [Lentisphaeria bacterium]|nr:hypothetical protein [Lentisphaeria bacterium]
MKHVAMFTLAAFALAGVYAAELPSVKTDVKEVYVYQPQKYSVRQGGFITNQFNTYKIVVTLSKPIGQKAPELAYNIDAGGFGYCALIRPLQLFVNDINMGKLLIKKEDFKPWKDGDKAGVELKLNFDGAKYSLISYMRPDSPVLWMTLKADPSSVEPAEKIQVKISNLTSYLAKNGKVPAWHGAYQRSYITPARTLEQQSKAYVLTPADNEITFTDKIFDGSGKGKGQGPTWFQFDSSAMVKGTITVRNDWVNSLVLDLKPDTKEFKFAYWQQRPQISNADFAKKLKAEKKAFTR